MIRLLGAEIFTFLPAAHSAHEARPEPNATDAVCRWDAGCGAEAPGRSASARELGTVVSVPYPTFVINTFSCITYKFCNFTGVNGTWTHAEDALLPISRTA